MGYPVTITPDRLPPAAPLGGTWAVEMPAFWKGYPGPGIDEGYWGDGFQFVHGEGWDLEEAMREARLDAESKGFLEEPKMRVGQDTFMHIEYHTPRGVVWTWSPGRVYPGDRDLDFEGKWMRY